MKIKFTLLALSLVFASCKDAKTETGVESSRLPSEVTIETANKVYPENLSKVFEAHGGIDHWNTMQTLKFTMTKAEGKEVTTTDLRNRTSLIEMPKHNMGYDGEMVWLHKTDTIAYQGNPKFYYNLMFYFYAMPFVLGDDGIVYEDATALEFEGQRYPGIKISYNSGVGESPEDEYIMYYDEETYQMAWLAYTVTYFTKEKGKEFHFIKYSDWQTLNGLSLPKTLSWYNYEKAMPTTKKNDVEFSEVMISTKKMDEKIFTMPEGAEAIE